MNWRIGVFSLLVPLFFTLTSCEQSKEKPTAEEEAEIKQNMADEAEVLNQGQLYVDAINSRDIDKIVKFWSPEAVYRNPITGDLVQGKDGIKTELTKIFDRLKDAKVEFKVETVRFPVEGKATEEGISILTLPGKEPIHSDYKIIHIKKDGKWLILHVSQLDFGMLKPQFEE